MAGSPDSTPASRRGFLCGAVTLPLVGVAAAAEPGPCPVAAAIARHGAAWRAWEAADDRIGLAFERLHALPVLDPPAALLARHGDLAMGLPPCRVGEPYGARQAVAIFKADPATRLITVPFPEEGPVATILRREPWPEGHRRRNSVVRAWRQHEAARQAREDASDLTGARAEEADAQRELDSSVAAVAAITATTLAGVLRKAQLVMSFYGDRTDLERQMESQDTHDLQLAFSIVRDLVDMDHAAGLTA